MSVRVLPPNTYTKIVWVLALMTFFACANCAAAQQDICTEWWEGNTRHWRYCKPPYVCDRANPGKCKPGPELQRQLDEEKRQLQNAAQTRLRVINRSIRKTWNVQIGIELNVDDQRTPECAVLNFGGAPAQFCVGDAARNVTGPINYGNPDNSRRVPSTRHKTLRMGMENRAKKYAARAGRKMARDITNTVEYFVGNEDFKGATDYLDKLIAERNRADSNDPRVSSLSEAIAYGQRRVEEARTKTHSPTISDSLWDTTIASSPPASAISQSGPTAGNEALCSFLVEVSQDRPGRPSAPIPAYCDGYRDFLSSLTPTPPRDYYETPIRIRMEDDEELRKMVEHFAKSGEQQSNAVPPGFESN